MDSSLKEAVLKIFDGKSISHSEFVEIAADTDIDYLTRIVALSNHWRKHYSTIKNNHEKDPRNACVDYLFDYNTLFTPIESNVWYSFRCIGGPFLYPQFPVDKYIADFANPHFKYIIEVDGKGYHLDKERDNERDKRLEDLGWCVFRIPGNKSIFYGEDLSTFHSKYLRGDIDCQEYEEKCLDFYSSIDGLLYSLRCIFWKEGFHDEFQFRSFTRGIKEFSSTNVDSFIKIGFDVFYKD
mgnify:CR=1 FL=1